MRAASLAYGALTALRDTTISQQAGNSIQSTRRNVLLSEVDFVSSVSGGSVTAAYWALHGTTEEFNEFEKIFLKRKVQDDLITRMLDPVSLLKFLGTRYSRSDALVDYYKEELFGEATYRDLLDLALRNQDRPYLIVNATDMDTRSLFPFVQLQLDLICEDLTKMPIAKAVAASTAYPLAFPAIVLENKSHLLDTCPKFLAKSKVDVGVKRNADIAVQVEKSWHDSQTVLDRQEKRVKKSQERLNRQTATLNAATAEAEEKKQTIVGVNQELWVVSRSLNQAEARHSTLGQNYNSVKSEEDHIYQQIRTLNAEKAGRIANYNRKLAEIEERRQRHATEKARILEDAGIGTRAWRLVVDRWTESTDDAIMSIWNGTECAPSEQGTFAEHGQERGPTARSETTAGQALAYNSVAMSDALREVAKWIELHPVRELKILGPEATVPTQGDATPMESLGPERSRRFLMDLRRSLRTLSERIAETVDEVNKLSGEVDLAGEDRENVTKVKRYLGALEGRVNAIGQKFADVNNRVKRLDEDSAGGAIEVERLEGTWDKLKQQADILKGLYGGLMPYMERLSEVRIEGFGNRLNAVDILLRRVEAESKYWEGCLRDFQAESDEVLGNLTVALHDVSEKAKTAYGAVERAKVEVDRLNDEANRSKEDLEALRLEEAAAEAREEGARRELERARKGLRDEEGKLEQVQKAEEGGRKYVDAVGSLREEHENASKKFLRQVRHYGEEDTKFVHLMDGGVADNVGFTPLIEVLDSLFPSEAMIRDLSRRWKARTNHVAVIVVDAKGSSQRRFSKKRKTPSFVETIGTTVSSAIEGKSRLLTDELERVTRKLKSDGVVASAFFVKVDFEGIDEFGTDGELARCRKAYERIPTNWKLEEEVVSALIDLGRAMVLNSTEYNDFVRGSGELPKGEMDVGAVCGLYGSELLAKFRDEPVSGTVVDDDSRGK